MRSDHVAETKAPSKAAFLQWLSATAPAALHKAPTVNYRLLTPVLATLVVSAAMLACGASDAPTSPDTDQPTVVTAAQQETGNNAGAGNGEQAETAKLENQQSGDSASGANATPEPTDKPQPTPLPTATATPEPTPTVVPTPTPDPKVTLFNLLRGFSGPTEVPEVPFLRDHNVELVKEAVAPHIADYVRSEYSDQIWDSKETIQGRVPYYINSERVEFEQITSDGDDLHVKITLQYEAEITAVNVYVHDVTVDAVIKAVEPPFESTAMTIPDWYQGQLDRAPIFSHLLNDPAIADGRKN